MGSTRNTSSIVGGHEADWFLRRPHAKEVKGYRSYRNFLNYVSVATGLVECAQTYAGAGLPRRPSSPTNVRWERRAASSLISVYEVQITSKRTDVVSWRLTK